jgi:hypothetical protein
MSLALSGNPNNITTLTAAVSSAANNGSGAVRVTTAAPHLFATNDTVIMSTTLYDQAWSITVISANVFDLNGSTFTATTTGTVQDISFTPQILVPTDGDTFSMQLSGMLSALQGILDRTQFLKIAPPPIVQVVSVAALRALPVGYYSNSLAVLVPENGTTYPYQFNGASLTNFAFGGTYYLDASCTLADNASTVVVPTHGSGAWRLVGGPVQKVYEVYGDGSFFSLTGTLAATGLTAVPLVGGSLTLIVPGGTPSPSAMYLNDIIECEMDGYFGSTSGTPDTQMQFENGGTVISSVLANVQGVVPFHLLVRYMVKASDVAAGGIVISPQMQQAGAGGTVFRIESLKYTIYRA